MKQQEDKKLDILNIGIILLSMITSNITIADIQSTINDLQYSSMIKEDYEMIKKIFTNPYMKSLYTELLQHNWRLDLPIKYNSNYTPVTNDYIEGFLDLDRNLFEVPVIVESDKDGILLETNNPENKIHLEKKNSGIKLEKNQDESPGIDWEGSNSSRVRLFDILHDEMNEIMEFSPDLQSNFDNPKGKNNYSDSSESIYSKKTDVNPFSKFNSEDKSSENYSIGESPIFDDKDIRLSDTSFHSNGVIEENSEEQSVESEKLIHEVDEELVELGIQRKESSMFDIQGKSDSEEIIDLEYIQEKFFDADKQVFVLDKENNSIAFPSRFIQHSSVANFINSNELQLKDADDGGVQSLIEKIEES